MQSLYQLRPGIGRAIANARGRTEADRPSKREKPHLSQFRDVSRREFAEAFASSALLATFVVSHLIHSLCNSNGWCQWRDAIVSSVVGLKAETEEASAGCATAADVTSIFM